MQSSVKMPEDLVTGRDTWYATICQECSAGCGTIVRVLEGRAKKIEGNPFHPVNRGKLCARGQAALQALYHPDRLNTPLRRTGERGSGQYKEIGWDEALREVTQKLAQLQEQKLADTVLLVTRPLRGHIARVTQLFSQSYGCQQVAYEPLEQTVLHTSIKQSFGAETLPDFDISSSGCILSFGADFLSTWLSPVRYGSNYGEFRQGNRKRGTLIQIEPRFSLTAANADEWVAIKPGAEGILALSLANVIISEGLADPRATSALTSGQGEKALADYTPQKVSQAVGIPESKIRGLARSFAKPAGGGTGLAIAGGSAAAHSNGAFNLKAVFLLNYLVGNIGKPGGIQLNPTPPVISLAAKVPATPFQDWQRLAGRLATGQPRPVNVALIHGANPVYGLPGAVGFTGALQKVPFIVAFSSFMDETSAQADIILPVNVPLEQWGADIPEPGPGFQVVSYQQPVVNQAGDSRSFADLLLTIGKGISPDMATALPWASHLEWLQKDSQELQKLNRGSVKDADFPTFWNKLLQKGGWWDESFSAFSKAPSVPVPPFPEATISTFSGSEQEYYLHLIPFPSHSITDGAGAHLPWLQATPDPVTTSVWETWIEIGPETARNLSLAEGDYTQIMSSPDSVLEAPVYINPLMPAGIVAVPLGQGHKFYTRYARDRGINVASLLAPISEKETGALAWAATRVKLIKTTKHRPLSKFEGVVPAFQLPDSEIIQLTPTSGPTAAALVTPDKADVTVRYKWGMAVDLDRCTGCQACVVACQAENNIPINTEEWFRERRAFEWIRIERYWGKGKAHFIPILCQQCENAPCEPVCPVYATSHNDQGLNVQVYPRCIGTRFCANNCPYQVRFFNFWPAVWPQSLRNQLNPDVTVRPRGIMEKCTFCIQRINRGVRLAKQQNRAVQESEVAPACVQTCPSNALVFGNLLDNQSRVSQLKHNPRAYRIMEKLGTEPSVTYLKKVVPDA